MRRWKKLLCLFLTLAMCLGMGNFNALADVTDGVDEIVVDMPDGTGSDEDGSGDVGTGDKDVDDADDAGDKDVDDADDAGDKDVDDADDAGGKDVDDADDAGETDEAVQTFGKALDALNGLTDPDEYLAGVQEALDYYQTLTEEQQAQIAELYADQLAALMGDNIALLNEEEEEEPETLKGKMEAVGVNVVTLDENTTVEETITIGFGVDTTLDLNGYTLTGTGDGTAVDPVGGNVFIYVNGGTLTIKDSSTETQSVTINNSGKTCSISKGMLTTAEGTMDSILVDNRGTLNLTGGTIGNPDAEGCHRIYVTDNSTMNMTGGAIVNSFVKDTPRSPEGEIRGEGGAVNIEKGSKLDMTGGAIVNNKTNGSGGGIRVYDNSTVLLSTNALVAGNTSNSWYGGGIEALNGCTVFLADGAEVASNYAGTGGGGIHVENGEFKMTGGIVADNIADSGEGGGIRLGEWSDDGSSRSVKGEITGGRIEGNCTNTTEHWGGGGIFVSQYSTLTIKRLLVTGNTANGMGGGVAGCSTGNVAVKGMEGLASYDNAANADSKHFSGTQSAKGADHAGWLLNGESIPYGEANDFYCAHESMVFGEMLGDGVANWSGYSSNDAYIKNADGYNPINVEKVKIAKGEFVNAGSMMALTANPSEKDKDTAKRLAKVFITGNHSNTHGGGIMCNGILEIGNITIEKGKPVDLTLNAKKNFTAENATTSALKGGDFTFKLLGADAVSEDGVFNLNNAIVNTAVNDENGNISFTITDLKPDDGQDMKEFTYYMAEQGDSANDVAKALGEITYDKAVYKITVMVTKETIYWLDQPMEVYVPTVTGVEKMQIVDGKLVADDSEETNTPVFVNTYKETPKDPTDPGTPPTDPETPPTDPETPPTDPGTPPTNPGTPPTNPGTPPTDPGTPVTEVPDDPTPTTEVPDDQTPTAEVPDDKTPLAELPDDPTPKADMPDDPTPTTELPDDEVPKSDAPLTGDSSLIWFMTAFASVIGLSLALRKREDKEA